MPVSSEAQRKAYLKAMGISLWQAREGMIPGASVAASSESPPQFTPVTEQPPVVDVEARIVPTALDWSQLRQAVNHCRACDLHHTRQQTVFAAADSQAEWMIVGGAPGDEESAQGQPFVGDAGKLLNEMLQALGLKREQVYVANVVNCPPADNREPLADEVAQCSGFLQRQIELVQPRVILLLGRVAANGVLNSDATLDELRVNFISVGSRKQRWW